MPRRSAAPARPRKKARHDAIDPASDSTPEAGAAPPKAEAAEPAGPSSQRMQFLALPFELLCTVLDVLVAEADSASLLAAVLSCKVLRCAGALGIATGWPELHCRWGTGFHERPFAPPPLFSRRRVVLGQVAQVKVDLQVLAAMADAATAPARVTRARTARRSALAASSSSSTAAATTQAGAAGGRGGGGGGGAAAAPAPLPPHAKSNLPVSGGVAARLLAQDLVNVKQITLEVRPCVRCGCACAWERRRNQSAHQMPRSPIRHVSCFARARRAGA